MSSEPKPRLVIIVADGPLMAGLPQQLAGRNAIHIPIASPPLPLAAIATTIVTGVSPIAHGIVTRSTVDQGTLEIRKVEVEDRHFQALWDGTNFNVKLINWPATEGDSKVISYECREEFEQAKSCLDADILGIVLPRPARAQHAPIEVQSTEKDLVEFLSELSLDTNVLIVHRGTTGAAATTKAQHSMYASFLVNNCEYETNQSSFWELIGGATYVLAGVTCPTGVKKPSWSFISAIEIEAEKPFPLNSTIDAVDWPEVIRRLVESDKNSGIVLLTQRFTSLVFVSYKKQLWEDLEYSSACLVQLRGKPFEYWMLILALEQQGKLEELQPIVEQLHNLYPEGYLTSIALCLTQLDEDKCREHLLKVDISKLGVHYALGAFGRMCLKAGLEEQGIEAVSLAIQKGVALFPDRAKLAQHFYAKEQYKEALRVLGRVGLASGEISWQVLRLNILIELDDADAVVEQASKVLHQNPAHELALNAISKYT